MEFGHLEGEPPYLEGTLTIYLWDDAEPGCRSQATHVTDPCVVWYGMFTYTNLLYHKKNQQNMQVDH